MLTGVKTAVISDLHLGSVGAADLLRDQEILDVLLAEIAPAERLVLLGDVIELRERPLAQALDRALPTLERIGEAMAGRPVVYVPGNHDHWLAEPLLEGLSMGRPATLDLTHTVRPRGPGSAVVKALGQAETELRYPGIWLSEDLYATHGHYLDCHLRLPRPEALAIAASLRFTGPLAPDPAPADYERALGPVYGLLQGVAQTGVFKRMAGPQHPTLSTWERINRGRNGGSVRDRIVARGAFPASVRAFSRMLCAPFEADVTPGGVARLGLEAMRDTVERLGIPAQDVLFSHTHNAGPTTGAGRTWTTREGVRLHNTGSWSFSRAVCASPEGKPLFWPGTVTWIENGKLERTNLLADRSHSDLVTVARRIGRAQR